jgi:hypothetical protein
MALPLNLLLAQLDNHPLISVAIGAVLLLIVTFLLSVPGARERIPHRLFRLFVPLSIYGLVSWWMIQVRHETASPTIALGFLAAAMADLFVPRRSRPGRHLTVTDWAAILRARKSS